MTLPACGNRKTWNFIQD